MTPQFSVLMLLALTGAGAAPPDDARTQAIAPFVGNEVAIVVRLDLARLSVEATARRLLGRFANEHEITQASQSTTDWIAALRQAGAKELFIVVDPADLPGPPIAVVPLAAGADARAIGQVLCGGGTAKPLFTWPTCATIHNAVFAGTTVALDRVRTEKPGSASRAEARPLPRQRTPQSRSWFSPARRTAAHPRGVLLHPAQGTWRRPRPSRLARTALGLARADDRTERQRPHRCSVDRTRRRQGSRPARTGFSEAVGTLDRG